MAESQPGNATKIARVFIEKNETLVLYMARFGRLDGIGPDGGEALAPGFIFDAWQPTEVMPIMGFAFILEIRP